MLEVVPTKSFKKDLKKYQHRQDVVKELYAVISVLAKEEALSPQKKDHSLYLKCFKIWEFGKDFVLIFARRSRRPKIVLYWI